MEIINGTRKVEVEVPVTSYKFQANNGDCHQDLTIRDGEIVETGCWDSRNGGGSSKGDYNFVNSCRDTIRFIVKYNPKELKNIYNALSEGPMKNFCRELQQEKMRELEF